MRIAVLVSGGGTNLESILQAKEEGELPGIDVVLVISSRVDALALQRAEHHHVSTAVIERRAYDSEETFQKALLEALTQAHVDIICMAGYLRKLGPDVIAKYRGRILNIHPALLPKFGGPGMYGHHVHAAVLAAREKESGCSVHVVDEEFDHGPILAQTRVPVRPDDTPDTLAERVLKEEHKLYPKTLREFCEKL